MEDRPARFTGMVFRHDRFRFEIGAGSRIGLVPSGHENYF